MLPCMDLPPTSRSDNVKEGASRRLRSCSLKQSQRHQTTVQITGRAVSLAREGWNRAGTISMFRERQGGRMQRHIVELQETLGRGVWQGA